MSIVFTNSFIKNLYRLLLIFIAISVAVFVATRFFKLELGNENYWGHHGIFLLFFLALFPRLTLLLSSLSTGGLIWWLSWLFAPRVLVAVLATLSYWQQNPILVIMAWLIAIGGESSEKYFVVRRSVRVARPYGFSHKQADTRKPRGEVIDIKPNSGSLNSQ
jgi:uncharacterized membrane protein YhaH (DUF805 family)